MQKQVNLSKMKFIWQSNLISPRKLIRMLMSLKDWWQHDIEVERMLLQTVFLIRYLFLKILLKMV